MQKVLLMIGTRKGGFLAASNPDRRSWEPKGPFLKGPEVHDITYLPKSGTIDLRVFVI